MEMLPTVDALHWVAEPARACSPTSDPHAQPFFKTKRSPSPTSRSASSA